MWEYMANTRVSQSCLLNEMGSMVATFWFIRVVRNTAYFTVIIEVFGQIFTALGPKQKSKGLFCWDSGCLVCDLSVCF